MTRQWSWAVTALLLAGCVSPAGLPGTGARMPGPATKDGGSLGSLVGGAITQEELELRDIQKRPNELAYPVRLGVLAYDFQSALRPEDQQALLANVSRDLEGSGLVKSTFQIPPSMLRGGDSIESIRKLSARFQIDVLLIVSGGQTFQRADNQPLGFFDAFTNRAYYEARTSLTAIAMNVYTGTFLAPFQAIGKAGPTLLDIDTADFQSAAYAMRQRAETAAFAQLKTDLVASLERLKATAVPPGSVSPSPAPSPSATPTESPSPAASPSPSPSAQ